MNRLHRSIGLTMLTTILLITAGCDMLTQQTNRKEKANITSNPIEGQYIVVLKEDDSFTTSHSKINYSKRTMADNGVNRTAVIEAATDLMTEAKINPEKSALHYYSHAIKGFSVKANAAQLEALKNDPRVKYVEPDYRVSLPPLEVHDAPLPPGLLHADKSKQKSVEGQDPKTKAMADYFPWGVSRVGGAVDASGYYAWVIDTGIDLDHSDLNVNTYYSASFVDSEPSPDDYNGHGTHVAGTIGAVYNGYGVVGVAANTTLFAVKVLDGNGSGSYSDVIAGLDYVARYAYPGEVANLSLGGPPSDALDDAVRNCADQGVLVTLAAGNDGDNANNYSPARVEYPNVWTVSAIDINDDFASFSNYGNPPIEWASPGVGVWSTWKGDTYKKISGTSMASPHVGGLLTTGSITADGYANGDPDGNPDPISYRQ
ncbi:MAG TPA: S8 family peptidase [Balneolaceae bacterium]